MGNKGFSLIEMLVTLALLGIILLAAFSIYISGNRIFNKSVDQKYVQQDVRLAADYISREIRNSKVISPLENDVKSSNNKYYALTLKTIGSEKFLVKQTMAVTGGSTTITEERIGSSLDSIVFFPSSVKGKLRVKISNNKKGQIYNLDYEVQLLNINFVNISDTGAETIYYAKHE